MTSKSCLVFVVLSVLVSMALGQYWDGDRGYRRGYRRGRGFQRPEDPDRDRKGVPNWDKDQEFKHDV
ncbi:MAG: hypothetical protein KDA84_13060, partial [Planctomycetaceae bacterium]|nr:hypothetical protein [Planctomycetaceae bacterium]